jgi:uncharacterized membrane protein YfcA
VSTPARLALIGLGAGFFGALFGVGGGVILVPLLILALAFPERVAMATSLGAIVLIALEGSVFYGVQGDLKPGAAALVGVPGAVGAFAGAALQQRMRNQTLALLFALLLVAVAVRLLV